uniref:Uncharacterized protein n=1 Tax=Aegilops tauschii TaxID=37682 RepID=N1R5J1_AEGTA
MERFSILVGCSRRGLWLVVAAVAEQCPRAWRKQWPPAMCADGSTPSKKRFKYDNVRSTPRMRHPWSSFDRLAKVKAHDELMQTMSLMFKRELCK